MSRRRAVLQLLKASLRGRGRELRGLAAWSAVQAVPGYLSGRLVALAIDDGFLARRPATGLAWLGLLAVSVVVGAWGTRQTFQRLSVLVEPFRDELVVLTVTGSLRRSILRDASADTAGVARLTTHVEIAREAFAGVLMVVQGFLVTAIGALLGLLSVVPIALALVLPPLAIGLALFIAALAAISGAQRASIMADEGLATTASDLAGGLRDVVACGGEETVAATVGIHIHEQARATRALARLSTLQTLAVAIGGWLPAVLILVGGPWLMRRGATTGAILGALTYVLQGVHPALQTLVRGVGDTGQWLFVALGRILEATEPPNSSVGNHAPRGQEGFQPAGYDLTLQDVTFRYGPWAEPVVSGLDLEIPEGDHLVVVGPSGAGKSTLAGLVAGMLDPQDGEARIGGICMRDVEVATLARHRVLIPQEAYVFDGTLRENLSYLSPDVSDADIDRAADRLGMRSLIERLGGYEARADPLSLSAGERQLVTLLRAYVSPAPIVILDEATCHLDPAAEAQVERAFARRPGTLMVIAHRISSARRARRILVMDGTRIFIGTHEELLDRSALYRSLVGHWLSDAVSTPVPSKT